MPDLTSNAATFRAGKARHTGYISIIPQTVVLSRAVNMATITYPVTTITFDNPYSGSGATADVQDGMTVIVYSGNTTTVKGKLRVAVGGASATVLQISEFAKGVVDLADNDKFEVVREFKIWDRLVSATAALNKDSRTVYSDEGSNPPPVACSGGPVTGFIAGGVLTANFYGSTSYAVDPDTVSALTHSWNFGDGTPASSSSANPSGVTFPAGFRWISHTVTDADNSKTATQRIPVWAHERTGVNAPLSVQMEARSYGSHETGWSARFRLPVGAQSDVSTLPDGALIVYFEEEYYDTSQASYGSNVTNRSHIKFVGFLVADTISIDPVSNEVVFEAVSALEILKRAPALPQLLLRDQTPANWQEVKTLTVNRAFWYLWHWGTTADIFQDFIWNPGTDLAYARLAVDNIDSVGGQLQDIANSINVKLTCDRLGRLLFVRDPNYLSASDRSALTTAYNLTTADLLSAEIQRQHRGNYKFVRGEGIVAGATVAAQAPVFASAPGNAPAWMGTGTETLSKQIVASQAAMNTRAGLHFARINGLYSGNFVPQDVTISLPDGYDWIDPAYFEWHTLTLASTTNKRGVSYSTATRWLLESADISYGIEDGTKDIRATISHETTGPDGVTYTPPKQNNLPAFTPLDIWFPIEDFTFTGSPILNAGTGKIALFLTDGVAITTNWSATSPNWIFYSLATLSMLGAIEDFTVDAFSPLYLGTGTTVNGWAATKERIYRITDIFGTIVATSQFTFGTALATAFSSRVIQTERGQQNFVVVASYYHGTEANGGGVYVTETTDGTTWDTEAALTTEDQTTNNAYLTPGVYVSGKLANTAYCSAMTSTGLEPLFVGYKTTNGGSSWATFSNPDVSGEWLPFVIHVPWDNNPSDAIMYYGSSGLTAGAFPVDGHVIRANGLTRTDITPATGGNNYTPGANHGIHTCDNNRQLVVVAGNFNNFPTVLRAVFVSRNGGTSWTLIQGPVTTAAESYVAASIGGDGNSIYLLGLGGLVGYSSDFGVTILDKTGDLASFSTARILNLCGGG